jgi:membrane-associated phospholipid phosphatase
MQKHLLTLVATLAALASAPAANLGVEPNAGRWTTWVIGDVHAFRVPPPPNRPASQKEAEDLEKTVANASPAARMSVEYWNAGSPAYRWIQIAQQEVDQHGLGGPGATRAMSLVAAGLNDAIIAAWDSKYAYGRARPSKIDRQIAPAVAVPNSPSYPSDYAAAATVASAVLDYLFPDDQAKIDGMAQAAAQSRAFAGVEFPTDIAAGTTLGKSVADAVLARARTDGSATPFTGSFPATPGKWSGANPSFPLAGTWKPWALDSGSQLRLDAPPAFGSPEFQAQVDAVRQQQRTVDQSHTAWFWQPSPIDPWIDLANRYLFESGYADDAPRVAQVYALAMVAQHDATIACWDTKYTYLEMRPVMADSNIVTLFPTPAHPSFPSGHACAAGAAAGVLSAVFPNAAADLTARAREAGLSTFYGGVHYPNDVERGLALGQAVAKVVLAKANPEVNTNE